MPLTLSERTGQSRAGYHRSLSELTVSIVCHGIAGERVDTGELFADANIYLQNFSNDPTVDPQTQSRMSQSLLSLGRRQVVTDELNQRVQRDLQTGNKELLVEDMGLLLLFRPDTYSSLMDSLSSRYVQKLFERPTPQTRPHAIVAAPRENSQIQQGKAVSPTRRSMFVKPTLQQSVRMELPLATRIAQVRAETVAKEQAAQRKLDAAKAAELEAQAKLERQGRESLNALVDELYPLLGTIGAREQLNEISKNGWRWGALDKTPVVDFDRYGFELNYIGTDLTADRLLELGNIPGDFGLSVSLRYPYETLRYYSEEWFRDSDGGDHVRAAVSTPGSAIAILKVKVFKGPSGYYFRVIYNNDELRDQTGLILPHDPVSSRRNLSDALVAVYGPGPTPKELEKEARHYLKIYRSERNRR